LASSTRVPPSPSTRRFWRCDGARGRDLVLGPDMAKATVPRMFPGPAGGSSFSLKRMSTSLVQRTASMSLLKMAKTHFPPLPLRVRRRVAVDLNAREAPRLFCDRTSQHLGYRRIQSWRPKLAASCVAKLRCMAELQARSNARRTARSRCRTCRPARCGAALKSAGPLVPTNQDEVKFPGLAQTLAQL